MRRSVVLTLLMGMSRFVYIAVKALANDEVPSYCIRNLKHAINHTIGYVDTSKTGAQTILICLTYTVVDDDDVVVVVIIVIICNRCNFLC